MFPGAGNSAAFCNGSDECYLLAGNQSSAAGFAADVQRNEILRCTKFLLKEGSERGKNRATFHNLRLQKPWTSVLVVSHLMALLADFKTLKSARSAGHCDGVA